MKKIIILPIFLMFSILVSSQNIENLDKKYGINIFKLGTSYSNYAANCTFDGKNEDGVKFYKYNKWYTIKIFNFSVANDVHLGFYKNKLFTISIDVTIINSNEFQLLRKKLEGLFGRSVPGPANEMYDDNCFWKTKKAYLGLNRYSCNSTYRPCSTNIYILSNIIDEQIKSDGF